MWIVDTALKTRAEQNAARSASASSALASWARA